MTASRPSPIIPPPPPAACGPGEPVGATFRPLAPRQRGRAAPPPGGAQGAQRAPLGNGTGNVSASPEERAKGRAKRYSRRYRMLDTAAELLPAHRVAWCGRLVLGESVEVLYHPEHGAASFGGVAVCGSVWTCPMCATRIAIARADELARAAAAWAERGGQLLMLTLTLRHQRQHRLAHLLAALNAAYRDLRGGRAFQVFKADYLLKGSVTAREITHGIKNGWHPHLHALLFLGKHTTPAEQARIRKFLYERWKKALAKHNLNATYEHGISLQDVAPENVPYMSKMGEAWSAANEVTGGQAKSARPGHQTPPQLLALAAAGDKRAARLYVEYAAATRGLKMLVWSKGLRKELLGEPEKTDQQIAEEKQSNAIILFELTLSQWSRILKYRLRGELLGECCAGDMDNPVQWLAGWGVVLCSSQMKYTLRDKNTV